MQLLFVGQKQHFVPSCTSKSLIGLLINVCLFKPVSHFALMEREGVTHKSNVGILSCTSGILLCTLLWTKWPSVSVCWQPLVNQKIWLPIFVDKDWLNSTNTMQSHQATCHRKALLKTSTLFANQLCFQNCPQHLPSWPFPYSPAHQPSMYNFPIVMSVMFPTRIRRKLSSPFRGLHLKSKQILWVFKPFKIFYEQCKNDSFLLWLEYIIGKHWWGAIIFLNL